MRGKIDPSINEPISQFIRTSTAPKQHNPTPRQRSNSILSIPQQLQSIGNPKHDLRPDVIHYFDKIRSSQGKRGVIEEYLIARIYRAVKTGKAMVVV